MVIETAGPYVGRTFPTHYVTVTPIDSRVQLYSCQVGKGVQRGPPGVPPCGGGLALSWCRAPASIPL